MDKLKVENGKNQGNWISKRLMDDMKAQTYKI